MRALLYKDLRNLRRYIYQLMAICLAFGLLFGISNGNLYFVSGYAAMIGIMILLNSMAYDEQCGWYRTALTMPVSRKALVGSKYLLGLLTVGGGAVYSLLLSAVGSFFLPFDPLAALATTGVCSCFALLIIAILTPLLLRYGTEKTRLLMTLIFVAPILLLLFLSRIGLPAPSAALLAGLMIALPFVCGAIYSLSFLISVRVFRIRLP